MCAVNRLDLYKEHKAEYAAPSKPALIRVGPAKYVAITGKGAPASEKFQKSIGALYSVAFTIKMAKKFAGQDYRVCHLEGLWWGSQEGVDFLAPPPDTWNWKLLIRVPDFIRNADVKAAIRSLREKGKRAEVGEVSLETINEGQCAQMLHMGPYDKEGETIAQMREFAKQQGLSCRGLHHEIYLSDPRRVPAERLRTILRYQMH